MSIHINLENALPLLDSLLNLLNKLNSSLKIAVPDFQNIDPKFQNIVSNLQDLKAHVSRSGNWESKDTFLHKVAELGNNICTILPDLVHKFKLGNNICTILSDLVLKFNHNTGDLSHLNDEIERADKALQEITGSHPNDEIEREDKASQRRPLETVEEVHRWKLCEEFFGEEFEHEILASPEMVNLRQSYYYLEEPERLCFLCFSIFAEKDIVKRRPLIYWWIGEGFINQIGNKTAEEVGDEIFQKFLDLGLIDPDSDNSDKPNPVVNRCRVHPWTRQMLISLAKEAKLFDFDSREDNTSTSRRACLISGNPNSSSSGVNASKYENLLTVFNVSESYLSLTREWLRKCKKLVVLQLGRWQNSPEHHIEGLKEEFLKELGAQKHLKYLCLRGISMINELPSSIVELLSLEILDLKGCHNLETLPSVIGRLRKLTHLDVSDCPLLESIPKGVQKLSSLQVLKGFVIGNTGEDPCKVADLAKLKKLRRLSIYVGNEAVVEKGEFLKLKDIGSLRCLSITWGAAPEDAITDLSFPQSLKKLDLRGFPWERPPKGLKPSELEGLKKLYIRGGKLKNLDHGETWKVEILRLKYLKVFKIDKSKLLNQFPDLIYLEVKCDEKRKEEHTPNKGVMYKEDFVLTKDEIAKEKKNTASREEVEDKPKRNIVSGTSEIEEMWSV